MNRDKRTDKTNAGNLSTTHFDICRKKQIHREKDVLQKRMTKRGWLCWTVYTQQTVKPESFYNRILTHESENTKPPNEVCETE